MDERIDQVLSASAVVGREFDIERLARYVG
jgi:hypothetical protein